MMVTVKSLVDGLHHRHHHRHRR